MDGKELTKAEQNEYFIITNTAHPQNQNFKKQLETKFKQRLMPFEDIVEMSPGEYSFYCARFAYKDEIKPEITLKLNRQYMDWKNMPFIIGFSSFFCILGFRYWQSTCAVREMTSYFSQKSGQFLNFAVPMGIYYCALRYHWVSLNNYYLEQKEDQQFDLECKEKYEEDYNKMIYD